MINGILQTPLKQIHDERGKVMHMFRATDTDFKGFGEVYFSWIYPDIVKAWHKHTKMTMNYAVPVGCIKVVLFDDRPESSTYGELNEFFMNDENYYRLTIPSGLWYGFKAVGNQSAMVVNCATLPHDPTEIVRIPFNDPMIPYTWEVQHG
ncbi:MAG: dTDP-4-dehydrorhamnose 3,5-epimerase family protein [Alphaproteobacteria bacterium]|nr:dTDP-4-dehydrorhamnose 3,5-epimerase family protein [Alphaproteobacteria bacterium]MBX9976739.1 dTDP-4-dehydrorhamnose 3,5-epimerase family protein [Alphaproteobacteria bacterium]